MAPQAGVFLQAEWRHLAMFNYTVAPSLLAPHVPPGTELDLWEGKSYISLVGFQFLNARIRGVSIPLHRNFDEVNLRFYVRRVTPHGLRRGVSFIKEVVPRAAITVVARWCYNENYVTAPMRHHIRYSQPEASTLDEVEYSWTYQGERHRMAASCHGACRAMDVGSPEEFIAEHYWGYSRSRSGALIEYEVRHPRWRIWKVSRAIFEGDPERLYGRALRSRLQGPPDSAFVAEGSPIEVCTGKT